LARPLEIILKGYHAQTVLLVGELTDICVHYTAVDAHQLDYRFRVITDMLTGSTPRAHEAALRAMKYLQRDALVTSKAVADWLDSKPLVA
jgi:nicotinamidase-related amidase